MKFEDVLPALRAGGKATIKGFLKNGEYFIAGYVALGDDHGDGTPRHLTLHLLNKEGKALFDKDSWGIPRWIIFDDGWEILK